MWLSDWVINTDGTSPSFTSLYTTQYKFPSSQYSIRLRYSVLETWLQGSAYWIGLSWGLAEERSPTKKFWRLLCFRDVTACQYRKKYSEVPTNDNTTHLQPTLWEIQTPKIHRYAPHILIKVTCKSITCRRTYLTRTVWNCYWETLPRGN